MNKLKKNSLFHKIILIIISIFLGVSLITFNYFSIGRSAGINGELDSSLNLSLTSSKDATWTPKNRSIHGEVTGSSGCGGSSKEGTLTITYIGIDDCTLTFDYQNVNNGEIKIDNAEASTNGSFSKSMKQNSSLDIFIKSNDSKTTSIDITNIKVAVDKNITLTFFPSNNGTYSVNGEIVTNERVFETKANIEFTLLAMANEGYKFASWTFNGKTISTDLEFKSNYTENGTIKCVFINKEAPLFSNNNTSFYDLQDAINSANTNTTGDKKIVLIESGTIFNNSNTEVNYDFNGIDLIIPSSSNFAKYDEPTFKTIDKNCVLYKKLSIDNNINLNFYANSNLVIDTEFIKAATGGSNGGGSPQGDYGQIELLGENSRIFLNDKSHLYAYGYITGNGIVRAKNGSEVVELFQINDFRGGSATSSMGNKVFPFNQYYVQNIESIIIYEYGCVERVYSGLYAAKDYSKINFTFIGYNDGLFKLSNNANLMRYYNGQNDTINYVLEKGTADISSISLKLKLSFISQTIDSKNYILPITNNMNIRINNSSMVNVNQDLCFLPGSKMCVESNATLNINSKCKIYLYDKNNWVGKKICRE